ncbi:MAG: hypothetical protein QW794_01545, partial [Thermosphaera sp.]
RLYGATFSNDLSTMARVTGAVCSEVALSLSEGQVRGEGVIPPEDLNNLELIVQRVLDKLKSIKVHVELEGLEVLGLTSS